ncbi:hypothetical protein QLH32_05155 [Acinetobacter corruptisaponis]|uniref:Uncharacterized protein n=1 Tax=Acinetobacter corruptisaponis TaxID=3045147 RepID=A0ABY8S6A9_9GAMM|nr:hypothetical protein [Acinetobacter sp. KCTC 92772]WHP06861.1 hypothetical protein QLH32_05155 [Acinetobacter sp. KCTC 92772]
MGEILYEQFNGFGYWFVTHGKFNQFDLFLNYEFQYGFMDLDDAKKWIEESDQ